MEFLVQQLRIPRLYVRPTLLNDVFVAALPNRWCSYVRAHLKLPDEFEYHTLYSPEEVQALLWDLESSLLGPNWTLLYIHVICNYNGSVLPSALSNTDVGPYLKDLTYSQHLHYVSQTNYKNLWKEAQKKFPEAYRPFALSRGARSQQRAASGPDALRALLGKTYNVPVISLQIDSVFNHTSQQPDRTLEAVAIFETTSHFLVLTEYIPHSVHRCLSLSPALLSPNSSRPMFVLFQLLHAVKELQDRSLFVEGVSWQRVFIQENLSLKVLPTVASSLIPLNTATKEPLKKEPNLQDLTLSWVRGCLSNFDYLVSLNDLAGRQMENPFNHPVMPWISDLSSPFGNWRDLTKSKFRLNKGDRQLDLTFDPATFETPEGKEVDSSTGSQVPHHVTDVLSEITYYVYKARRTARSVLCRYVRPHWNPLEYPTSIERMQQWTPDECIPQFFSDPSIFKSIHEDLPDLGYPAWAANPEDFIAKHRNALESPYVSERLHQWIDLTFGFRLSGSTAVKSKNVHLSLVDQHIHLSGRGIVQLFSQPHPRRLLPSPYVGRSPPRLPPAGRSPTEEQLPLPLDYNPVGLLRQMETVSHFHGSGSPKPSISAHSTEAISTSAMTTIALRRQRDIQWIMTLALELFLPQRFYLLRAEASLEERMQLCRDFLQFEQHQIPRSLRAFIQTVIRNDVVTSEGLPPPSAHQLLQPMISLIPFPDEFPTVLTLSRQLLNLQDHSRSDFATIGKALARLAPSNLQLLVPYIKALLLKTKTAYWAALYLLEPVAVVLGPLESAKEFLPIILKLMGPDQPSPALVFLYHKRFLLMLQVRLGLRCFLHNLSLLLVEAVGGCYDVESTASSIQPMLPSSVSSQSLSLDPLKISKDSEQQVEMLNESELEGGTGEVFSFEVGEEAALMLEQSGGDEAIHASSRTPSRSSTKFSLAGTAYPVRDIHQLEGCNVSQVAVDSLLWQGHRLGPVLTARHLTRNLLRMLALCYVDDTSLNLAGAQTSIEVNNSSSPFQPSSCALQLQGDYNANRILTCLTSFATLYGEQMILLQYFPHAAEVVVRCSAGTGSTISLMLEGGLIGCCSLLMACIPYLQDSSLMLCLQDILLDQLIDPMIDAVTSTQLVFSRGGSARSALTVKLLDCLCAVAIRLGADQAIHFVSNPVLKLLKIFERVNKVSSVGSPATGTRSGGNGHVNGGRPDWMGHQRRLSNTLRQAQAAADIEAAIPPSGVSLRSVATEAQSLTEIADTFTDQFAFQLLSALNLILGVTRVQALLEMGGQAAQKFAANFVSREKEQPQTSDSISRRRTSVYSGLRINRSYSNEADSSTATASSFGSRVSVVGNRIQLFAEEESVNVDPQPNTGNDLGPTLEEAQDLLCYRKTDSARHLRGNWLAYWEHEAGRADRDTRFNFKQIRLLQMNGHNAGIRSLHVMDSETGFLSAGRDKTARVWSLHSQGDGNSCVSASYVYQQHRKPLLGVCFVDTTRLAASCDGSIHLWDPFVGTSVRQLDATSNTRYPTVTAMKTLPVQSVLVAATAEGTLRLLDTRSPLGYQHDLKISPVAAGLVRCLATGPNGYWVAAGHSSGILSLMDIRTGLLISSWKGHEGEVLQVNGWTSTTSAAGSNSNSAQLLISSSLDQSVSVWSVDDGKFKFSLRGFAEPVHCLSMTGSGELITATTANRIGVHSSLSSGSVGSFTSTKLRSDTFKGVLTAMAVLPLNRMLLLGSDTGGVTLLS